MVKWWLHSWQTFKYVTNGITYAARPPNYCVLLRATVLEKWSLSLMRPGFAQWQHDSRELFNLSDQIVTCSITRRRKSFCLRRRRVGGEGQLASTIRQPGDKRYITLWGSQTNERHSRSIHSGCTQPHRHPATFISCSLDMWVPYSCRFSIITLHINWLFHNWTCIIWRSVLLKKVSVMSNIIQQNHQLYINCTQGFMSKFQFFCVNLV